MRRERLVLLLIASCDPNSQESVSTSSVDTVQPPSFLSAPPSSTSGNVRVEWGWSPSSGVDRYELQQSTSGEWTPAYSGPALRVDLRYVAAATVTYRVRACIRST